MHLVAATCTDVVRCKGSHLEDINAGLVDGAAHQAARVHPASQDIIFIKAQVKAWVRTQSSCTLFHHH